jgi:hypothetical protein
MQVEITPPLTAQAGSKDEKIIELTESTGRFMRRAGRNSTLRCTGIASHIISICRSSPVVDPAGRHPGDERIDNEF